MKFARMSFAKLTIVPIFLLAAFAISPSSAQNAAPPSGADVYQNRCAKCHDQEGTRAPAKQVLQKMSSARIMRTLDFGLMMAVAYPMKRDERITVANYLGTQGEDAPPPASAFCATGMTPLSAASAQVLV